MVSGSADRSDSFTANPVDLDGLESLLDQAHLETVATNEEAIPNPNEVQLINELLEQLKSVYEILRETNDGLIRANARIANLSSIEHEQSKQLVLLQIRTQQIEVLENRLFELEAENTSLRRGWLKKAFHFFKTVLA